jgi:hypothetical protein
MPIVYVALLLQRVASLEKVCNEPKNILQG